ncbi:MAG: DNA-3-methyladenine glycosylase [Bacteroidales bacterium]|jgi:DNA-3-methyladenine glycosylase|nr:DNA-3-methyladenine glycosylase [Bacteroidales bacterium]MDY0084639.1 DNA-3-methyladenine glycosylase [Bacteroidales bacterium]
MTEPVLVDQSFFLRDDVVAIARDLIGKIILVEDQKTVKAGIIAETEAYAGETDRASHAYGGRRTNRTETLYLSGGHVYVYLCYGIHHLLNFVTNQAGIPHAVLIRGIVPVDKEYLPLCFATRFAKWEGLANGPGKLSRILGVCMEHNGILLNESKIRIYESKSQTSMEILTSSRIGVDYAGEDAHLPYRFHLKHYKPVK